MNAAALGCPGPKNVLKLNAFLGVFMPQDWAFRLQRGWGSKLAFSLLGTGLITYFFLRPVRYKVCSVLSYLQGSSFAISSCQHLFTLRESFSSPITSGSVILLSGIIPFSLIVISEALLGGHPLGTSRPDYLRLSLSPRIFDGQFTAAQTAWLDRRQPQCTFSHNNSNACELFMQHNSEHVLSQLRSQCTMYIQNIWKIYKRELKFELLLPSYTFRDGHGLCLLWRLFICPNLVTPMRWKEPVLHRFTCRCPTVQ